jgi:YD repeat-containing protein
MFARVRRITIVAMLSAPVLLATVIPDVVKASTSYTYDQLGRLITALYDNGTCVAYAYDANGNRTSQVITISGGPETPVWGTGIWGCFVWTSP